jgi:hypothetical protein
MEIRNQTPHVAGFHVQIDKEAAEQLVVCVRGTWALDERGRLSTVEEPPPFLPADECVGEPGLSSVRYEADLGQVKPATDCALIGHAVAPRGRARSMSVTFRVGEVAGKAKVRGERKRLFWLLRWWNSPTSNFARVPLVWELAAGGTDATPKNPKHHSLDMRNPFGRGFRSRGSKLKRAGAPLPQIETPGGCLPFGRGREPAGFGLTGGQWAHRRKFAGTYDDVWMENRAPLLPEDFDERFHCAAAPGLTTKAPLRGGEPVEVTGCTRTGKLAFRLPAGQLRVTATLDGAPETVPMSMQTVMVDTDAMQLRVIWRGALHVHGRFLRLKHIDIADDGAGT